MYKNSIRFFEIAAKIQKNEFKSRLMVTRCYLRMVEVTKALKLYRETHKEIPKISSVSHSLFAVVVEIMFLVYYQIICKTEKKIILTIRFKAFYCIFKIYDSNNDASLMSSDEKEEEISESEDEDN